jgi:hypothetical protein
VELYIKGYDKNNKAVQLVVECEYMRYMDEYCCEHDFEIYTTYNILMEDNEIFYYRKSAEVQNCGHLYICLRGVRFECMTKEYFKETFKNENVIRIY